MNRSSNRPFPASLFYRLVPSEHFPTLDCWGCGGFLDVHQPDPDHPDHLLGTCPKCGRWYRISPSSKETDLIVVDLPDPGQAGQAT